MQNSAALNGTQRVLLDQVITQEECSALKHLAHVRPSHSRVFGVLISFIISNFCPFRLSPWQETVTEGGCLLTLQMKSLKEPLFSKPYRYTHSLLEKHVFLKIKQKTAALIHCVTVFLQYGYEGRVPMSSARLFYDISERARRIIESYFLLNSTLHFSYTHLVCRTAITGQNKHQHQMFSVT